MRTVQTTWLMDYHLHTGVSMDCRMKEREACERALVQGIREIAFTNHIRLNRPDYIISPEACLAHWERIQACEEQFPELKIRLGIEMDYYPGREQEIGCTLRHYERLLGRPFDLVLGAIHELNGVFFSKKRHAPELFSECDLAAVYRAYFDIAAQAVQSKLFDVMAHPDLIKKFTYELTPYLAFSEYKPAVEAYLDALLEAGVGLELNTKGLKRKVNEIYPSREMLALYVEKARAAGMDPILTMGSDAHQVEEVGGGLLEGVALLKSLRVKSLTRFIDHQKSTWQI